MVKRLCSENDATWKILPQHFFQFKNRDLYFSGNHPLLSKQPIPSFYSELHTIYMNHFKKEPDNILQILNQSLWLNKYITVNNKFLHIKSWENKGINQVKDILNGKCEFLNHDELKQQYNIEASFLLTLQIQATIPQISKILSVSVHFYLSTPIGNTISINKTYTSLQKNFIGT